MDRGIVKARLARMKEIIEEEKTCMEDEERFNKLEEEFMELASANNRDFAEERQKTLQ